MQPAGAPPPAPQPDGDSIVPHPRRCTHTTSGRLLSPGPVTHPTRPKLTVQGDTGDTAAAGSVPRGNRRNRTCHLRIFSAALRLLSLEP